MIRSQLASITPGRVALLAIVAIAVAINLLGVAAILWLMAQGQNGQDWRYYVEAGRRAWAGLPIYEWSASYEFRYSPLMAYVLGAIAPIGLVGWRIASLASLLLLPRRLALVAVVSVPLWLDLYAGNVLTVAFVLAACALAGKRWAIGGYLVATLLIPRPLMFPVAAWLLWKRPEWRLRFALLIAVHALALVILDGEGWLHSFIAGRSDFGTYFDFGPARFMGVAWVPIGLALAVWLTWKGRLGYASLAASPYWLPYYPLMLLLELRERGSSGPSAARADSEDQDGHIVSMCLAPARVQGSSGDEGNLGRQENRISSVGVQE